jgi:hypothetical protein
MEMKKQAESLPPASPVRPGCSITGNHCIPVEAEPVRIFHPLSLLHTRLKYILHLLL